MESAAYDFIANVAFPIGVAGFLLVDVSRRLEAMRTELVAVRIRLALILQRLNIPDPGEGGDGG